jgi:CRISPR-associated protein Cmr3
MNTLLLQPTDVLFFRDGRPMSGSLAGHTAAWPLPDVTNHALHAALHKAGLEGVHAHRRGRSGVYSDERDRKFGSLLTAGPFPVDGSGRWFFPRPKDAQLNGSVKVTLQPVRSLAKDGNEDPWLGSSLPAPLEYAVANTCPPEKDAGGEPWLSADAFNAYLRGEEFSPKANDDAHFLRDDSIADKEASLGIAIDPDTQTTGQGAAAGKIYTAHYLRLRDGFRLGVFAEAMDKVNGDQKEKRDLLHRMLNGHPTQIVVGGQQRICTAELKPLASLPLPRGLTDGFNSTAEDAPKRWLIKWVLLSPAVWPEIPAGTSRRRTETRFHPGGWLPNWICPETGAVLLRSVNETERRRRRNLNYAGKGYETYEGNAAKISARLVAAIVPKPIVVTGWALPSAADPGRDADGGAKSTHFAVPAGAIYYFEADSADDAVALANALNWHGATPGTEIKNRRSTLLGEKGYGLGVCGTWKPFGDVP